MPETFEEGDYPITGDYPPNLEILPGAIKIDDIPTQWNFDNIIKKFLRKHKGIETGAEESGQDIVARTTLRGKKLLVGAGIVGTAAIIIAGGIVIYHHVRRGESLEPEGIQNRMK